MVQDMTYVYWQDQGRTPGNEKGPLVRIKATHGSQLLPVPLGTAQCLSVPETCCSPSQAFSALSQNSDSTLNQQICTLAVQ